MKYVYKDLKWKLNTCGLWGSFHKFVSLKKSIYSFNYILPVFFDNLYQQKLLKRTLKKDLFLELEKWHIVSLARITIKSVWVWLGVGLNCFCSMKTLIKILSLSQGACSMAKIITESKCGIFFPNYTLHIVDIAIA